MTIRLTARALARLQKTGPPVPTEREVMLSVVSYLEARGCVVIRCNSGAVAAGEGASRRFVRFNSAPGCSDLLVCYRGQFIAIECKRIGGKLSAKQAAFLDRVRVAGGIGAVVRSIEDAEIVLSNFEE